jgi:hypothetical protein
MPAGQPLRVRDLIREIMWAARREHYEGASDEGQRPRVCIDSAAGDDQSAVAVAEREDGASSGGRVDG